MKTRTDTQTALSLSAISLASYSMLLSTCLAQRMDTFLMAPHKPSTRDAPAYISSVGHRVAIAGDFVFVADGYAGLEVYRLSGEGNARLVGEYPTGEYTHAVRVNGNRVYAWDSLKGTVVFDAHDPMKLRSVALSDISPEAMARAFRDNGATDSDSINGVAAIVEHRVYIARADLGVAVIEMRSPLDVPPPSFRNGVMSYQAVVPGSASSADPQVIRVDLGSVPAEATIQYNTSVVPLDDAPVPAGEHLVAINTSAARLELTANVEAGTLRLWISGPVGQSVHVQRSSSLSGSWEDWQTITLSEAPTELVDEETAGAGQIFYRAVSP